MAKREFPTEKEEVKETKEVEKKEKPTKKSGVAKSQ